MGLKESGQPSHAEQELEPGEVRSAAAELREMVTKGLPGITELEFTRGKTIYSFNSNAEIFNGDEYSEQFKMSISTPADNDPFGTPTSSTLVVAEGIPVPVGWNVKDHKDYINYSTDCNDYFATSQTNSRLAVENSGYLIQGFLIAAKEQLSEVVAAPHPPRKGFRKLFR